MSVSVVPASVSVRDRAPLATVYRLCATQRYCEAVLASLLPGLRDLRVPLSAGFMWLVVLWLIFYQAIPTQDEASGLAAEVYAVMGAFGPAALTAAVSFIAYLIGILIAPLTTNVVRLIYEELWKAAALTDVGRPVSFSTFVEAKDLAATTARETFEADLEPIGFLPTSEDMTLWEMQPEEERKRRKSAAMADHFQRGMSDDIPLVATRLLAHNRELFDRYDRAHAEASFRFTITVPLIVVSVLVPLRVGLPWWGYLISIATGALVSALLIWDGGRKLRESNDAIYQAVFVEEVQFPSIETAQARIKDRRDRSRAIQEEWDRRNGEIS